MSRVLAVALLWSTLMAAALAADLFAVPPELWDRPRTARVVLEQPSLRQAINLYLSLPNSQLLIHHGAGQEPLLQAEELRTWLMALAIDGARIRLVNDAKLNEPLNIEISK